MRAWKRYLLLTVGDVEPHVLGPFKTDRARDRAALAAKRRHGENTGIFPLDLGRDGEIDCWAYQNRFFDAVRAEPHYPDR